MLKARVNFPGHGCAPLKGSKRHSSICEEISVVVGFYVFIIVVTVFHFYGIHGVRSRQLVPWGRGSSHGGMRSCRQTLSPGPHQNMK